MVHHMLTFLRELDHYPLDFHSDKDEIKQRLITRGKKMLDMQGLNYSCYTGIALHSGDSDCISKHNVEGRVLIDVVGYNKFHLAQGKRENKNPETERNYAAERRRRRRRQIQEDSDDEDAAERKLKSSRKRLSEKEQARNREEMLKNEDDLGFMSGMVGGYALKNKLWGTLLDTHRDVEIQFTNSPQFNSTLKTSPL